MPQGRGGEGVEILQRVGMVGKKRGVLKPDRKGLREGVRDPLYCVDAANYDSQAQWGLSLHRWIEQHGGDW